MADSIVTVSESGLRPYGQVVTAGRHVMSADEPEARGGRDSGASPYEYVLAGLGACTAMTVRMYADRHGWPLEKVTVDLRHEKVDAADGSGKVDRFNRIIRLAGPLSDEQQAKLVEIAGRCPVSRTLKQASEVTATLG